jgi:hypothetical protein
VTGVEVHRDVTRDTIWRPQLKPFARTLIALLAIAAAASMQAAPAKVTRKATLSYVGSWDPISPVFCTPRAGQNYGEVCFPIKKGDKRVTIRIVDAVQAETGFFWRFLNANRTCAKPASGDLGGCDSSGSACPLAKNLAIPKNAKTLQVMPSGVVLGPLQCNSAGKTSTGAATTGTVTATFFDR